MPKQSLIESGEKKKENTVVNQPDEEEAVEGLGLHETEEDRIKTEESEGMQEQNKN